MRKTLADDGTLRGVRAADNQARVCLLIMAFLLNIAATWVSKSTGIAIPLFFPTLERKCKIIIAIQKENKL